MHITKWEKKIKCKNGSMLYDVREMALWKKQNYAKHRKVSIYQEFVKRIQKGRICGKFRQMKPLCIISTKVDTWYTFLLIHRMYRTKGEPYCTPGTLNDIIVPLVIKTYTIPLDGDFYNKGSNTFVKMFSLKEISIYSTQFCWKCKSKIKHV